VVNMTAMVATVMLQMLMRDRLNMLQRYVLCQFCLYDTLEVHIAT